jgi:hypothetical protein
MNDTPPNLPAQGPDVEWQIEALQRQVFLLLLALIVVTATVVFYFYYQSRMLTNDLNKNRPAALQIIEGYNANARAIDTFESQVISYGASHPAFQQQVLKKYGLAPAVAPAR